jgi:hypothetical protein
MCFIEARVRNTQGLCVYLDSTCKTTTTAVVSTAVAADAAHLLDVFVDKIGLAYANRLSVGL